jgi:phosphate-selective porin OprO/OprP
MNNRYGLRRLRFFALFALWLSATSLRGDETFAPMPAGMADAAIFQPPQAAARVALPSDVDPFAPQAFEVETVSAQLPVPPTADGAIEQLQRRLADVEKQLKKRDEADKKAADKKKAEEFPSFKVTGFTQLDGVVFNQDPTNIATVGNAQDGVGFRRARFAFVGKVAEFTNYMFEFDFANAGHPSFFDVWVEQGNLPYLGTVRGGQYCQPFSVDALTGFRNLTFLERSLPFLAFVPFRRVGFMAYNQSEDQMTQWAYSVFKTGGFNNAPLGDDRFATDIGDKGGYSFSTRATHLLKYDELAPDRYLWHIGGGFDYSRLGANTAAGSPSNVPYYQARTTPEFGPLGNSEVSQTFGQAFATNPIFIDTGRYPADSFNIYGLETVYQHGALGVTSEFMATTVDSTVGPIFYHGAYVQAAYRLTGENRVYDKKTGTLGKIIPYTDFISLTKGRRGIHGWGAWEVAARYSYLDLHNPVALNGHYLNGTSAAGTGLLQDSTVGLTWFLNTHCKVQFNWIHAMLDNTAKGYSQADLFCSRLQVDF